MIKGFNYRCHLSVEKWENCISQYVAALTDWSMEDVVIIRRVWFPNKCCGLSIWPLLVKLLSGESQNNDRHATSHYLGQNWPRAMSPYSVTRVTKLKSSTFHYTYKKEQIVVVNNNKLNQNVFRGKLDSNSKARIAPSIRVGWFCFDE